MIFLSNSWLSDSGSLGVFIGILGVIFSIISIIFAIVIYRRQRIFKEISYQVLSDAPIVSIDKRVKDKIRIIYADMDSSKEINDAHLLVLKVWNSGKVDVKVWNSEDPIAKIEEYEVPIRFEFKGRQVLSCGVETEPVDDVIEPEDLNTYLTQESSFQNENGYVELPHCLLKPNQSLTLTMLLTGSKGKVTSRGKLVDGRITAFIPDKRPVVIRTSILALVGILIIVLVTNTLINLVISINNAQLQKQVTQQQSHGTDLIKKTTTISENIRLSCDCSDPVIVTITKIVVEPALNRMVWSLTFYNISQNRLFAHFDQFSLQDQLGGQIYNSTGGMRVEDVILKANETKQATLTFSFVPFKAIPYILESQLGIGVGSTINLIQFNPIVIEF